MTLKCKKCGAVVSQEEIAKHFAAKGGKATSKAKAAAARKNAKLGGWPKGKPRPKKK